MSKRVSDVDLEFMVDVMRGHREPGECDHSRELADAIVGELRRLRAVADAARKFTLAALYDQIEAAEEEIEDALREAGE